VKSTPPAVIIAKVSPPLNIESSAQISATTTTVDTGKLIRILEVINKYLSDDLFNVHDF
jgi:hypothetical protein